MGGKKRDYGKCNICNKLLKRPGKKCSGCSPLYYNVRHANPNADEDELIRLTKEKYNILMKKQRDRCVNGVKNGW